MIDAPSGGAPEQAPRWDLVDTESCGGGIRVLAPYLIVWGYVGIYRRKEWEHSNFKKIPTHTQDHGDA